MWFNIKKRRHTMTYLIEVENKFETAKRNITVRRRNWGESLEETTVSYPALKGPGETFIPETAKMSLDSLIDAGEYLEISVNDPNLEMGPCRVELPPDAPFTFIANDPGCVTVLPNDRETHTNVLRIPSGLPTWKLEIMPPQNLYETGKETNIVETALLQTPLEEQQTINNVTVGDDEPGGGG